MVGMLLTALDAPIFIAIAIWQWGRWLGSRDAVFFRLSHSRQCIGQFASEIFVEYCINY